MTQPFPFANFDRRYDVEGLGSGAGLHVYGAACQSGQTAIGQVTSPQGSRQAEESLYIAVQS